MEQNSLFTRMHIGSFFYWMLLFIPLTIYANFGLHNKILTFIFATLSIIPLARILGYATKEIALQTNATTGGLLSATFGNIIELIIAILALQQGLTRVVEASIIGSIIGNILLLIGLSILIGGFKFKHQHFNSQTIGVSSTMLIIAVVGLTIPSVYLATTGNHAQTQLLSDSVAIVLALIYIAGLYFTMKTHRDMFDSSDEVKATHEKPTMTVREAGWMLFFATLSAALISELLVGSIHATITTFGMTETFIGIIVIAIITNIAEKATAIQFALDNKLDISLEIGMSSAIQIALFVVPILVFVSQIFGYGFTLAFTIFEIVCMLLAVMIINHLASDGQCNWLEGAQLITVYAIIATAFYFL